MSLCVMVLRARHAGHVLRESSNTCHGSTEPEGDTGDTVLTCGYAGDTVGDTGDTVETR